MSETIQTEQNIEAIQDAELRQAVQEIAAIGNEPDEFLNEVGSGTVSQGQRRADDPTAIKEREMEYFRNRATQQRQRGQREIKRRHQGIASILRTVEINERVIASTFERFYPIIEKGIYLVSKNGDVFLGDSADTVLSMTFERIKAIEQKTKTTLEAAEKRVGDQIGREDFIQPSYVAPTILHEIQVRNVYANRLVGTFLLQDRVISHLQTLNWNGEIDPVEIEEQEQSFKNAIRELATDLSRALRAMQNRISGVALRSATQKPATNPATRIAEAA